MKRIIAIALMAVACFLVMGQEPDKVTIAFDPSPDPNVVGYFVYWTAVTNSVGTNRVAVSSTNTVVYLGRTTTFTLTNLVAGTTYRISAAAVNFYGLESADITMFYTPPPRPPGRLRRVNSTEE